MYIHIHQLLCVSFKERPKINEVVKGIWSHIRARYQEPLMKNRQRGNMYPTQ